MGNVHIGIEAMLGSLGVDVVSPPECTRRTLSLATKYSPEGICIPFKLNLGNMIEALERGADTILNVTGQGTCRMGYYFNVQEKILRDMGYQFQMMLTGLSEHKLVSFMKMLKKVANGAPWHRIIAAFGFGMAKITAVDDIEIVANEVRAVELKKGTATRIYRRGVAAIKNAADFGTLKNLARDYCRELRAIKAVPGAKPLKVLVVGEIYVVLDPYANMDVELELGKLGVATRRSLYLSRWLKNGLVMNPFGLDQWREVHRAAMPYLKRDVGGDGWETVGEKVVGSRHYDGMVHLAPFTCMPEGIAQNIMPVTREKLPVLAVYCDEQTSKAGMLTRLEAFVDMLRLKQKRTGSETAI
jgi:predicted nucleotide-binding protein (sugar kinase/HSP70/actin superfamily)